MLLQRPQLRAIAVTRPLQRMQHPAAASARRIVVSRMRRRILALRMRSPVA
jgi:hypothetical protein